MLDGCCIHGGQLEPLHDPVDLGRILGTNHHIHHTIGRFLFAPEGAVNNTVPFGFLCKAFEMFFADGEHLQLLAAFQHGIQPLIAFGLVPVLVLGDGIEGCGDILSGRAGKPQGNFRTLQTHPNDLFRRIP